MSINRITGDLLFLFIHICGAAGFEEDKSLIWCYSLNMTNEGVFRPRWIVLTIVLLLSSALSVPADTPVFPEGDTFEWGPDGAAIQVLAVLERSDYSDYVLGRVMSEAGEGVRYTVQPFSTYHNTNPRSWNLRILFVPVYGDALAIPALRYLDRLERIDNVLLVVTYRDGGFSSVPEGVDVISSSTVDMTTAESLADSAVQQVRAMLFQSP